jgi:hypothetical protein
MEKGKGGEKHDYNKSAQEPPDQCGDSEGAIANGSWHEARNASHASQDLDWEKPPAYEFHGSGPNIETSVVAQGKEKFSVSIF